MTVRSYGQHCSLARSLDLLGERWTLLVLRELMLGPARYGELLDALPGAGTNLLSTRLKSLEAAEVIRRSAGGYELAARGEALRPVMEELGVWGFELMPEAPGDDVVQPRWAALLMRAMMLRGDGPAVEGVFAFEPADDPFWVRSAGGRVDARRGAAPVPPDATIRCDLPTFFAVALGAVTPRDAIAAGDLEVEGERRAAERLLKVFRLPATPFHPKPRGS
ncbi:MAG: Transcriptional regulator, HxlR family [uncultured Solirubrobacteraceae bacterium]|uniref:Transcriptional regulator, HxlR family n=1 Tax=uncultured Solirubrobacteraceae bacterium TaxID=1162706 RepID=A0A6J4TGW8_9ACTN|nr:MAG: Transcriptional regulator, HxlR family [uncultured Solirubrobacteraceae bacterium]